MSISLQPLGPVRLALVLAATAGVVAGGRYAARRARQPEVIGEIAAGLLAGPLALRLLGPGTFHQVLPEQLLAQLKTVSQVGLALFMVSLAHKLRHGAARPADSVAGPASGHADGTTGRPIDRPTGRRAVGWVAAGSFLLPLAAGVLLAVWLLGSGDPALRGTAPAPAFVLLMAVSLSVTAVPVLARILTDRGMEQTAVGQVAFCAAVILDSLSWLALVASVSLGSGDPGHLLRALAALAAGIVALLLLRRVLGAHAAERLAARAPLAAAVLVGVLAVAAADAMEDAGMTAIIGAVLAGLALPDRADGPWATAVASVARWGRALLPVFFVVSGLTVLTGGLGGTSVTLVVLTVLLGTLGKAGGGYAGARLAGYDRLDSLRVGALMNTRGLTELIVLQVGVSAGILTPPVYLAYLVMALASTALTGPGLRLIDRAEPRRDPLRFAARASAEARVRAKGDPL